MTTPIVEFEERRKVAIELLRMKDEGAVFWPFVVEWAAKHALVERQVTRAPVLQDKIIAALKKARPFGLKAREIVEALGINAHSIHEALGRMVLKKSILRSSQQRGSRYFLDATEMATWCAWNERNQAEEAQHAEKRRAALLTMRDDANAKRTQARLAGRAVREHVREQRKAELQKLKEARLPRRPLPHQAFTLGQRAIAAPKPASPPPAAPAPAKKSIRESVFIPEVVPVPVQVQHLPSGRDTRFTVDPGVPLTGGFMDEWRDKREKGK